MGDESEGKEDGAEEADDEGGCVAKLDSDRSENSIPRRAGDILR
jgi:hypothetical protein